MVIICDSLLWNLITILFMDCTYKNMKCPFNVQF